MSKAREWIEFIGLGFFSDKKAKQGKLCRYVNFLLWFVLAIVLLFCGVIAADIVPFSSLYGRAGAYQEFIHNAFTPDGISLKVHDNSITANVGGDAFDNARICDTFIIDSDREKYSVNGYNLVVDTRSPEAYDAFEAYCVKGNTEISYEDYRALDDADKKGYSFNIRYTPNEFVLTDAVTVGQEQFLTQESERDENLAADYAKLKAKKGSMSPADYSKAVHELYLNAYYPALTETPYLRNYYYKYTNSSDKYLIVFADTCVGSFTTDGGIAVTFTGIYKDIKNGIISPESIDGFIKDSVYGNSSFRIYVYLLNILWVALFVVGVPLIVSLFAYILLRKVIENEFCDVYSDCLKVISSFTLYASLFAAFITFVCGFFIQKDVLLMLELGVFSLIILVRTIVLLIREKIASKSLIHNNECEI